MKKPSGVVIIEAYLHNDKLSALRLYHLFVLIRFLWKEEEGVISISSLEHSELYMFYCNKVYCVFFPPARNHDRVG